MEGAFHKQYSNDSNVEATVGNLTFKIWQLGDCTWKTCSYLSILAVRFLNYFSNEVFF